MYIPEKHGKDHENKPPFTAGNSSVSGNVIVLGAVSLVTDVSSEMITAILPVYLMLGLGLSPLQLGFVDGLYGGISVLVRLAGGYVADRFQSRKTVAGFGYGLSAFSKLGFLAAGTSVVWISAVIGIDRIGKGLRTAPRDALIALSSTPETLGRSFGVHRAMDTAGAVAGPLVAFAILWKIPNGYDAVFVVSFCVAIAGLVILVAFVRDRRNPLLDHRQVSLTAIRGLLNESQFRRICVIATCLGAVTISDAFIFLLLQRRLDLTIAYFPLLPIGTASIYMLLAIPLGRLADRTGRWPIFLFGNSALAGVYGLLLSPLEGIWLAAPVLGLHGFFYAATNGVLMAIASPSLSPELRTSGLALVQTCTALASLLSSITFGWLWSASGPYAAVEYYMIGLLFTLIAVSTYCFYRKAARVENMS